MNSSYMVSITEGKKGSLDMTCVEIVEAGLKSAQVSKAQSDEAIIQRLEDLKVCGQVFVVVGKGNIDGASEKRIFTILKESGYNVSISKPPQ